MSSLPDADLNRPHHLYRCFDAEGSLLYVGVAVSVEDRMFHHTHPCNTHKQPNGSIRRHMATWTSEQHPTKLAARDAERRAIHDESPLLNRQHNPRRFRKLGRGANYVLLEPVHPLSREAFPDYPVVAQRCLVPINDFGDECGYVAVGVAYGDVAQEEASVCKGHLTAIARGEVDDWRLTTPPGGEA